VTTEKRFIHHFHCEAAADDFYKGALPDWPSVDDLNNQKRFYMVRLIKTLIIVSFGLL